MKNIELFLYAMLAIEINYFKKLVKLKS